MKRITWFMVAAFVVALASPALAGGAGKCGEGTQACLNHWAKSKDKGWAGLQYDTAESGATSVKTIAAGSPAASAGFMVGDVLVTMNGAKMTDKEAMKKAKGEWKIGQSVSYTVTRGGAEKQIAVTLGKIPEDVYASMVGDHMLGNHVVTAMAEAGQDAESAKAAKSNKK